MKGIKKISLITLFTLFLILVTVTLAACNQTAEEIAVSQIPFKEEYVFGEALDVSGGEITIKWNKGEDSTIPMDSNGVSCNPTTLDRIGNAVKITVTYEKKTSSFTVKVNPVAITKIERSSMPNKLNYIMGESLDLSGGAIAITYNDPTKNKIVPMVGSEFTSIFSVSGFNDNTVPGQKAIRITLDEDHTKYVDFSVMVNVDPDIVESMVISQQIEKKSYYSGEPLSLASGKIKITYKINNVTNDFDVNMNNSFMFTASGFDTNAIGSQSVIIKLNSSTKPLSVTFNVEVIPDNVFTLSVQSTPSNTEYYRYEELDITGGIVRVTYLSGKLENVPMNDSRFEIQGNTSSIGIGISVNVILKADITKKTAFSITVRANPISSIRITTAPDKDTYFTCEGLNLSGGNLELIYTYPTNLPITENYDMGTQDFPKKFGISGFNNTADKNEKQTITVYPLDYRNTSTEFSIDYVKRTVASLEMETWPTAFVYFADLGVTLSEGSLRINYLDGGHSISPIKNEAFEVTLLETQNPVVKTVRFSYTEEIYAEFPILVIDFLGIEELAINAYELMYALATNQAYDATQLLLMYDDLTFYLFDIYLPEDEYAWIAEQYPECPYAEYFIDMAEYAICNIPVKDNPNNPSIYDLVDMVYSFLNNDSKPDGVSRWGIYNLITTQNLYDFMEYYLLCARVYLSDQSVVSKYPDFAISLWEAFVSLTADEQYYFLNIIDGPNFEGSYFDAKHNLQYNVLRANNVFSAIMSSYYSFLKTTYGTPVANAFTYMLIATEMRITYLYWLQNKQGHKDFIVISVSCLFYLGAYTDAVDSMAGMNNNQWKAFDVLFKDYYEFLISECERLTPNEED